MQLTCMHSYIPAPSEITIQYFGRGFVFDDIEEAIAISKEIHCCFLYVFVKLGSTEFYNKYIIMPTTSKEIKTHATEMMVAGFPGCFGSTDAKHILLWNRVQSFSLFGSTSWEYSGK